MTKKFIKIIIWIHLIVFYAIITFANDITIANKINVVISITIFILISEKIIIFSRKNESLSIMMYAKAFPYMLGNFGLLFLIQKILEIIFNLFGFH